ncbi:N-6 DNA methylase, partial [Sediminivirga luteola]
APPPPPMRRAVAFASNIKESQRVAGMFERVTEQLSAGHDDALLCRARHVDGGMNVLERTTRLQWLEAQLADDEIRILTNARCLSEGVDVPDLDAVLFLNPRNSQVDVVQSVGRVMRRAKGKDYGYIILPVGIPVGQDPATALKDSKKYKVIWSVLNALRSHDDRFEALVNKIDLNQARDTKINIIGVGTGSEDDDSIVSGGQQLELDFPGLDEWKDAIYARIVEKVGDREYWENWSRTIADVAARHTDRITALVTQNPSPEVTAKFDQFVAALQHNLNEGITDADAISMLSQHLITKPVFDALFERYDFAAHNPVSQVMQSMVDLLQGNNLEAETAELNSFYASVSRRASGIDNPDGKQRIITELYENFFKQAFPKQADALGVVYTPIEVVDFIIRAVDDLSREHFGAGLTDEGVHVLDPFTGTGTFIVRLLQSGVIAPHDLARKYAHELHANEIMLLAYYIAAINIEATYHGLVEGDYRPFEGIVLGDTFQMTEDGNTFDLEVFASNNERAQRQLDADIRVVVGNPPYSAGQTSANDNNANTSYPTLDGRIRDTYAARTQGQNKNSLYDSYIRAIRWGTDRLGHTGILAYVSNGGYIDSNSADGLRKSLVEDFDRDCRTFR